MFESLKVERPEFLTPVLLADFLIKADFCFIAKPFALDQSSDGGAVEPQDQIAFPVTRNSTILDLGRAFTDHDLRSDELLASLSGTCPGHAQRATGAKTRGQFAAQRTTALHVEGLVDRFGR